MPNKKIRWDKIALLQINEAISYIEQFSIQNAEKVSQGLLQKIASLSQHPEKYPPDRFKENNDNNKYRAFELYHYRISYYITSGAITIVRIRHTKREPLQY